MQVSPDQQVAAAHKLAELVPGLTGLAYVAIADAVLDAVPEASVDMDDAQATLADSFTRFLEIAAGQRAAAEAAGFSPTAAEMMGATAYQAMMMKMATG